MFSYYPDSLSLADNRNASPLGYCYGNGGTKTVVGYEMATKGTTKRGDGDMVYQYILIATFIARTSPRITVATMSH